MHYYKKNIGDYHKKAGRLSMLEHGAYTLLLDACYDREQFPTLEEAIDWTWARTEAEIDAVKFVLSKFFTLEDGRYVQNRIKEELEGYAQKSLKNSEIAKEREEKRKNQSRNVHETSPSEHEAPPNHKPLTNNQEPLTTNQEPQTTNHGFSKQPTTENETSLPDSQSKSAKKHGSSLPLDWALPKSWGEWALENTELDVDAIRLEAEKFKDHWLANSNRATGRKADWAATWRNWARNAKPEKTAKTKTQQILANNDKAISAFIGNGQVIDGEVIHA